MEDHELPIDLSDILMFTNRGMDVMYSINGVFVTHNGKEIIFGDFDKQSQLWYFNIKNILKIPDIPNLEIKNTDNESTVLIVNRLKAEDISIIRQIHKNFAHLGPSALPNIIDSKVLDDVPIGLTGSAIRSLNKTQQCIVCEAGRGKELPAKEGSGATPGIIGAYWSVDYVGPINPPTTWGCNGFIVYEELATGYLVAFLVKDKSDSYIATTHRLLTLNQSFGHIQIILEQIQALLNSVKNSRML
jgi:hypothetical protein